MKAHAGLFGWRCGKARAAVSMIVGGIRCCRRYEWDNQSGGVETVAENTAG